ncbi:MAG: NACHT domain-containing protein [Myxococcales bacterium]
MLDLGTREPGRRATVIVAASGMGKTTELRVECERLRRASVPAFLIGATGLVESGIPTDDRQLFEEWKQTTSLAVFFIDAIDEAALRQQDLARVIDSFRAAVDPQTKRFHILLSCRAGRWAPPQHEEYLRQTLALESPVRSVALQPLSTDDVARWAKDRGVQDADRLVERLIEEDLDGLLELRPPDAEMLVAFWKTHGEFGTWSRMLDAFINEAIRENNEPHREARTFPLAQARPALQRIAAATILSRQPLVALPGHHGEGAVDGEALFADCAPSQIGQFLHLGILEPKGHGNVQLPQGPPSDFLGAEWVMERRAGGWDEDILWDTLVKYPFGSTRPWVPRTRSSLLGWVASMVPAFRKRLVRELPHVALFEGDPSCLAPEEAKAALRRLISDIRKGKATPSPTIGTLHQVAKHRLAGDVLALLPGCQDSSDAEQLLLHLAESGRYAKVVPAALKIAADQSRNDLSRRAAVDVVRVAGTMPQRQALLGLCDDASESLRVALADALVPDLLHGKPLVDLIAGLKSRRAIFVIAPVLARVPLVDVDAAIAAIQPAVSGEGDDDRTQTLVELAARLLVEHLKQSSSTRVDAVAPLLVAIERHLAHHTYLSSDATEQLRGLLLRAPALRRATWDLALRTFEDADTAWLWGRRSVIAVAGEDFEWLCSVYSSAADARLKSLLLVLIDSSYRLIGVVHRQRRRGGAQLDGALLRLLDGIDSDRLAEKGRKVAQEGAEAQKKADIRAANERALAPRKLEISAGTDERLMTWAWMQLDGDGHKHGRIGMGGLIDVVGPDLAESFVAGLQRWWRLKSPPMPDPGVNEASVAVLAGLTGISLELERRPDARLLSDDEVRLAAAYALYEINGLPPWFETLRNARPAVVASVLKAAVAAEWDSPSESYRLIGRAPFEPAGTRKVIQNLIIDLMEARSPPATGTVHHAVTALLPVLEEDQRDVAGALRSLLTRHPSDAAEADLIRGWAHREPLEALQWLQRRQDADGYSALVIKVAGLLDEDFSGGHGTSVRFAWPVEALEEWVALLLAVVRPEDDPDHKGIFRPGDRDHAKTFRDRCLYALAGDPSPAARSSLLRMRRRPDLASYGQMITSLLSTQFEVAAEALASSWTEKDILACEQGDDRIPRNRGELFELVQRHLRRLARLIENDDFSYARLFKPDTREAEVQAWAASCLRLLGGALYSVTRESEVQDDKKIDIQAAVSGVGRVPVEIKLAERYSFAQLRATIADQLLGRYLRPKEADHGVLLLVSVSAHRWQMDKRSLTLSQLRTVLCRHATKIATEQGKQIEVLLIDIAAARRSAEKLRKPPR